MTATPKTPDDPEYDECTDNCEFDPYEDGDTAEESWHYKRTCESCGEIWWGLHCVHDGVQNPCPKCGTVPGGKRTPYEILTGIKSPKAQRLQADTERSTDNG